MNLPSIAREIRKNIIELAAHSKSPHVGSALSCADILTVLFAKVLKMDPWESRDVFILSKAHAAMALYSTLYVRGLIKKELLDGYCHNDGTLPAHLDRFTMKYVEVSAGSLGHGFNMGLGMAYGFKDKKEPRNVYALIGDGESQEGSIWEGALFAPKMKLDNFTVIVDYNNLQGYGCPNEICSFAPFAEKWRAFGWHTVEVDGHDHAALQQAVTECTFGKPRAVIAHTTKGKGVPFMENQLIWHYYIVTEEIRKQALEALG